MSRRNRRPFRFGSFGLHGGAGSIDRKLDARRSRRLHAETLEDRRMMATDLDTNLGQFEPYVAVNPANPANVVATQFNQIVISTDYGRTFSAPVNARLPPALAGAGYGFGGDPVLAFDAAGTTLFWTYLSTIDTNGDGNNEDQTVVIQRVNPLTGAQIGTTIDLAPGNFADDKEWLAVDDDPQSPFFGNIYVVWSRLDGNPDQLLFSRSTDGGVTFSAPALISDPNGADNILGNGDDEEFVWPPHIEVGPSGDVFVSYHIDVAPNGQGDNPNGGPIVVLRSSNGGADFAAGTVNQKSTAFAAGAAQINDNTRTDPTVIAGAQFWTQGAFAPYLLADPVRTGRLYIIGNDDPNNVFGAGDEGDVVMAVSNDNGLTWSAPQTISHAPAGTLQVFPQAAIDELGNIAVFWYDNRRGLTNGAGNFLLDVFATVSRDGGATFSNDFRVNDATFDPDLNAPQRFAGPPPTLRIGEYNGIASSQGVVHVVWTGNDPGSGVQEVFYDQFNALGAFADPGEQNNSISTATVLGSLSKITVNDATLDTPADIDFYKVTANSTGKLNINLFFHAGVANLRLRVLDRFGNVVATGVQNNVVAGQDVESIVIPVVSQRDYWIEVDYDPTDPVNNPIVYDLEIENFQAPAPTFIDLVATSDTGMMNNDNVTFDTTPSFLIQADLADFQAMGITLLNQVTIDPNNDGVATDATDDGAGVYVSLLNLATGALVDGFANPVGATGLLWSFTSSALTAGEWFVSTAVQIVDGADTGVLAGIQRATGRAQLADPLTLTIEGDFEGAIAGSTIDLLSSSDTGMSDTDNVTAKWSPAFSGAGPANAKVHVFAQATNPATGAPVGPRLLVGSGVVGSDGTLVQPGEEFPLGLWEVTVEPMDEGKWLFTAQFETAGGLLSDPVGLVANLTTNANLPIPDNGTVNSQRTIAATDFVGAVGNAANMFVPVADVDVTINITHPITAELDIALIAPNGTVIDLSSDNGAAANYTGTVFDDDAGTAITAGASPFTGRFRPEQPLSGLNGLNALGQWTLRLTDDTGANVGTLVDWTLRIVTPLMVVIDKTAPNTPFLDLLTDTGRHSDDNITKDNTPDVSMTTTDPNIALAQLLFTDNLKFRIFDRFENGAPEVLIYDSSVDAVADAATLAGDMFTSLIQLTRTLPVLTPLSPAIIAGALADGVHNLKLEVEDRAGNISEDFLLTITVDTATPPVSFGLPDASSTIDGLTASSDTGVSTNPATAADRITSDTTPTMWGRAEADTVVRLFLDRNGNGVIDLLTDTFLGQTVAQPFDGNDAFPDGYWEITSALDLNQVVGLPLDGLRSLLVTAEDVAGNPMPMNNQITTGVDELSIFLDTQGPQVTNVQVAGALNYDLFDPKPSTDGPTPLVRALVISFRDLPTRVNSPGVVNDFLYDTLDALTAAVGGNYQLVGDHVGFIPIVSPPVVDNIQERLNTTVSAVVNASTFTAGALVGAAVQPVVGDFVRFTSGANNGTLRQITAFNVATGQFTVDVALGAAPAVGDTFAVVPAANLNLATVTLNFATPLPDDRFTLTVSDNLTDPAGNRLDGESNADEPQELPVFPSGDGVRGGAFVARFTVDSRPEIGTFVAQNIAIDINGNYVWDPANAQIGNDATNVDLSFTLPVTGAGGVIGQGGYNVNDLVFAGRFSLNNGGASDGFDTLGAFGFSAELGVFRWIVDRNHDGVVDPAGGDILTTQPTATGLPALNVPGAIPVAGNFVGGAGSDDEIGLYFHGNWAFDTNKNFVIDPADTFFVNGMMGAPIVGDFDGDGLDDLGVFNNNQFFLNFRNDGLNDPADQTITWGFPGVLDKPVAADMDRDGIDDIGLWVPRNSAATPRPQSEWYFLISNDPAATRRVTGQAVTLNHPFTPIPFGFDKYAEFGDDLALPIVGNFDPPVSRTAAPKALQLVDNHRSMGDFDGSGATDQADLALWKSSFGSTTNLSADGNGDGIVDSADYSVWRDNLGASTLVGGGSTVAQAMAAPSMSVRVVTPTMIADYLIAEPAFETEPAQPAYFFAPTSTQPSGTSRRLVAIDTAYSAVDGSELLLSGVIRAPEAGDSEATPESAFDEAFEDSDRDQGEADSPELGYAVAGWAAL